MNEAVLPWYILHQTVIIVIAMWLTPLKLGGFVESILLIVCTFLTCGIGFEIIKRFNILRFMFGMKLMPKVVLQPSLQTK